ncbi:hypothetical protein SPRG_05939 [Saprolegnia parasitica CBS 223.65]|uniref:Uncharacterized protein n=1 Tax=Saprolegnia parasitica (strain CBS 223.65) TaxID=695850 RepID=A0A067CRG4_SAPPC|nr:hypothetical protein SPRG_05939 [Saprolegnia parasitica CBS 223.65]KDO29402.1 hypothetical protein SPRG_05939 [Saprolegnia parasitica CBS 223.65]|eukprot:XP_012199904.1 hypothetical protein SPRG_05939 [Saprolegnia parasitica CBS 223.65]
MALRSFSKDTLQDNWYEERCEPLQGVLPYDEKTRYVTTVEADFVNPVAIQRRHEQHKKTPRPRLLRNDNYEEAVAARPLRHRPEAGFGAVLPTPDPSLSSRHLKTINQEAFGHLALPAGGAGGVRVEHGKAASGASGEIVRQHADPQKDTHAQRSWMYTKDPILSRVRPGGSNNQEVEAIKSPPAHHRRQSTNITTVYKKKDGIYYDD